MSKSKTVQRKTLEYILASQRTCMSKLNLVELPSELTKLISQIKSGEITKVIVVDNDFDRMPVKVYVAIHDAFRQSGKSDSKVRFPIPWFSHINDTNKDVTFLYPYGYMENKFDYNDDLTNSFISNDCSALVHVSSFGGDARDATVLRYVKSELEMNSTTYRAGVSITYPGESAIDCDVLMELADKQGTFYPVNTIIHSLKVMGGNAVNSFSHDLVKLAWMLPAMDSADNSTGVIVTDIRCSTKQYSAVITGKYIAVTLRGVPHIVNGKVEYDDITIGALFQSLFLSIIGSPVDKRQYAGNVPQMLLHPLHVHTKRQWGLPLNNDTVTTHIFNLIDSVKCIRLYMPRVDFEARTIVAGLFHHALLVNGVYNGSYVVPSYVKSGELWLFNITLPNRTIGVMLSTKEEAMADPNGIVIRDINKTISAVHARSADITLYIGGELHIAPVSSGGNQISLIPSDFTRYEITRDDAVTMFGNMITSRCGRAPSDIIYSEMADSDFMYVGPNLQRPSYFSVDDSSFNAKEEMKRQVEKYIKWNAIATGVN